MSIFVRDELVAWQTASRKPAFSEQQLRDNVGQNVEVIVKRAQSLSCQAERQKEKLEPVNQTILDLISQAVNPMKLAQMGKRMRIIIKILPLCPACKMETKSCLDNKSLLKKVGFLFISLNQDTCLKEHSMHLL